MTYYDQIAEIFRLSAAISPSGCPIAEGRDHNLWRVGLGAVLSAGNRISKHRVRVIYNILELTRHGIEKKPSFEDGDAKNRHIH